MSKRPGDRCGHATDPPAQWLMNKILCWPAMLTCVNCEQAPGRLVLTFPNATCRNFHPRRKLAVWTEPPKPHRHDLRYIPLTKGYYAVRSEKGKTILMYREILNAPPDKVVDHIDGTSLNNSQANLHLCTKQQNLYNSRPRRRKSQYKGVRYEKRTGKWVAEITHRGKRHHLGSFDSEIAAARACDRKARLLFGPYARPNFPDEPAVPKSKKPEHRP